MSGVAIIRALLLAHQPVVDLIGTKVYAGIVPQDVVLPAIGVTEISRREINTTALSQATVLVTARVQVTALTKNYPATKALIQAAKLGPGSHTLMVAGYTVRSVVRGSVGPDLSDEDAGIFEQSRDFMVTYVEEN